jgi:ferredoxin
MEPQVRISFSTSEVPAVEVSAGAALSEVLDRPDAPVFFGCKTGNCGTCLIEVSEAALAQLPPPSPEERDWLETLAPGNPRARLACQLHAICDLEIRSL